MKPWMSPHFTYHQRGEVYICRVSARRHLLISADGSHVFGFVSTLKQAEEAAARLDADLRREALRSLRGADATAEVLA